MEGVDKDEIVLGFGGKLAEEPIRGHPVCGRHIRIDGLFDGGANAIEVLRGIEQTDFQITAEPVPGNQRVENVGAAEHGRSGRGACRPTEGAAIFIGVPVNGIGLAIPGGGAHTCQVSAVTNIGYRASAKGGRNLVALRLSEDQFAGSQFRELGCNHGS